MLTEKSSKSYVKLSLGRTRLLLPGEELLSIEPSQNVKLSTQPTGAVGLISINGAEFPVFALDENLECTATSGKDNQVCVCLTSSPAPLCILCDDATLLQLEDIKLHALPDCMYSGNTIISNIAVSNENLYCLSGTMYLTQLIENACPGPEARTQHD